MKLPKIPKGARITGLRIRQKETRADVATTMDDVYLYGTACLDQETALTCYNYDAPDGQKTELKVVIIHGGLLPMAADMESFHLRVRDKRSTMTIRFKNGGHLELDDMYPHIAWEFKNEPIAEALLAGESV